MRYAELRLFENDSALVKDVFVLGIADGQDSLGSGGAHDKLKAHLTRYDGDEGNCAIGILASGNLAFRVAEIENRRSRAIYLFTTILRK
jgi:hypothetical protein